MELLLSYEASCNSADDKGSSPLHLASWAGHAPIVEVLLTRGPSISNVNLTVNELLDLQGNLTFLVWLLCFLTQFFLISLILKNSRVVVFCLSNLFTYSPELAVPCYFLDNMEKMLLHLCQIETIFCSATHLEGLTAVTCSIHCPVCILGTTLSFFKNFNL